MSLLSFYKIGTIFLNYLLHQKSLMEFIYHLAYSGFEGTEYELEQYLDYINKVHKFPNKHLEKQDIVSSPEGKTYIKLVSNSIIGWYIAPFLKILG